MKIKYSVDAVERWVATAFEVGIPSLTVAQLNLPVAWIPVGTVVLAAIKVLFAKYVGNKNTAAMISTDKD